MVVATRTVDPLPAISRQGARLARLHPAPATLLGQQPAQWATEPPPPPPPPSPQVNRPASHTHMLLGECPAGPPPGGLAGRLTARAGRLCGENFGLGCHLLGARPTGRRRGNAAPAGPPPGGLYFRRFAGGGTGGALRWNWRVEGAGGAPRATKTPALFARPSTDVLRPAGVCCAGVPRPWGPRRAWALPPRGWN